MRWVFTLILLTPLPIGVGCDTRPAATPTPATEPPPAPPAPGRTTSPVPADESLTPEEYIRLGLPAHDRVWLGHDMVQAEKVLASLAAGGERRLPRYRSDRSGAVFARMTAPENLDGLRNRGTTIDARFPLSISYFQATNQVLKLYLGAFLKGEVRDSEMVELVGSQLRATVVALDLVDEFIPTLDKDDPTYPNRMRGLEGVRGALGGVVAGSLQTLTEREAYRVSERARLVGYMEETLPRLVPRLLPGSRAETLKRLEAMQTDPALADLQPGLGRVRERVLSALDGKARP